MTWKRWAVLLLIVAGGIGLWWIAEPDSVDRYRALSEDRVSIARGSSPLVPSPSPGINRPPVQPAPDATLAGSEPVIGVEAGGRSRAYRLSALSGISAHVVNDVVGDVPVTVTYCNLDDCVRTFTGEARGEPLKLGQAGYLNGKGMVLDVGGKLYLQGTGEPPFRSDRQPPFPYRPTPASRTTWEAWKAAHPDTDVYVGPLGTDRGEMR